MFYQDEFGNIYAVTTTGPCNFSSTVLQPAAGEVMSEVNPFISDDDFLRSIGIDPA